MVEVCPHGSNELIYCSICYATKLIKSCIINQAERWYDSCGDMKETEFLKKLIEEYKKLREEE